MRWSKKQDNQQKQPTQRREDAKKVLFLKKTSMKIRGPVVTLKKRFAFKPSFASLRLCVGSLFWLAVTLGSAQAVKV